MDKKENYTDVINYFLHPKRFPNTQKVNIKELVIILVFILCLGYLIVDPATEFIGGVVTKVGYQSASPILISSALLIAPFFEEFVHRGFLSVKSFYFIPFILSLLFLSIRVSFIFGSIIPTLIGSSLVGFFTFIAFVKRDLRLIIIIFRKNFRLYFYAIAIVFSVIHLTSNDLNEGLAICSFKVFIDYFPGAVILGYIRVKYGIAVSIAFHSIHNALVLLLNQWIY